VNSSVTNQLMIFLKIIIFLTALLYSTFALLLSNPNFFWATVTSAISCLEMFSTSGRNRSTFALLFVDITIRGNVRTVRSVAVVRASVAHHGRPVCVCRNSNSDIAAPTGGQLGDKN